MSRLGEFVLRKLSRDPSAPDYLPDHYVQKHQDPTAQIQFLERTFPAIKAILSGKRVLNIGCAEGQEALGISMLGAREVCGIDIRIDRRENERIRKKHPDRQLEFAFVDAHNLAFAAETFDAVITVDAFEHFADPYSVLKESARVLKEDGRIFLTSGVWAHPWGSHMNFFTMVPWVQFLFSEATIMNVRRLYRSDGANRFSEVEGGMNKIGVRRLKKIVKQLQLNTEYLNLRPVKGLKTLTRIPLVNEFFTGQIVAVLKKELSRRPAALSGQPA